MVLYIDTLRLTRIDCPTYGNNEVLPTGIAQYGLQFACIPYLDFFFVIIALGISNYAVKVLFVLQYTLLVHSISSIHGSKKN